GPGMGGNRAPAGKDAGSAPQTPGACPGTRGEGPGYGRRCRMSSWVPAGSPAACRIGSWQPTRRLVEALANDQRARWERGERPAVEAYLDQYPALRDDPEAAIDLIYDEVLLRKERGEVVQLTEYLRRFPQWAAQLRDQFEFHEALGTGSLAAS